MVLDHVVAERDDEVGVVDRAGDVVARLQADRVEAVVGVHVDGALRHEGAGDADAGLLA